MLCLSLNQDLQDYSSLLIDNGFALGIKEEEGNL